MSDSFKIPFTPAPPASIKADAKDVEQPSDLPKDSPTDAPSQIALRYAEPSWSGTPETDFTLEVIKNGSLIEKIDLTRKPYIVFGRLPDCDVILEHPSISRYHAILQYKNEGAGPSSGFYLYDLGSTHGTRVNKETIRARTYYRIRLGHVVRFGGSTRVFVLQGDEGSQVGVEMEAEAEMVEFVKEKVATEERQRQEEEEEEKRRAKEEKEGVSWGMVDDSRDIEMSLRKPDIIDEDAYYNRDPKKALKRFMDQEGMEIEYESEDVGKSYNREFKVTIKLPIQGPGGELMCGEGISAKKKEAVVLCALDACRILDAQGMLRSSAGERRKKIRRNWEENDYYDSDEDSFLDRTGDLDKKRKNRMRKVGKYKENVETYESLISKLDSVHDEIQKGEKKLSLARKIEKGGEDTSLEDFMTNLSGVLDASAKRNIRIQLVELRKKEEELNTLIKLARPSEITKIIKRTTKEEEDEKKTIPETETIATSDRKKGRYGLVKVPKDVSDVFRSDPRDETTKRELVKIDYEDGKEEKKKTDRGQRVIGPAKPVSGILEQSVEEEEEGDDEDEEDEEEEDDEEENVRVEAKRRKRRERRQKLRAKMLEGADRRTKKFKGWDSDRDPEFAQWLPPEDQSGDGKTKLNEKLGY